MVSVETSVAKKNDSVQSKAVGIKQNNNHNVGKPKAIAQQRSIFPVKPVTTRPVTKVPAMQIDGGQSTIHKNPTSSLVRNTGSGGGGGGSFPRDPSTGKFLKRNGGGSTSSQFGGSATQQSHHPGQQYQQNHQEQPFHSNNNHNDGYISRPACNQSYYPSNAPGYRLF